MCLDSQRTCPECRKAVISYQIHPVYAIRALYADLDSKQPQVTHRTQTAKCSNSSAEISAFNCQSEIRKGQQAKKWKLDGSIWTPYSDKSAGSLLSTPFNTTSAGDGHRAGTSIGGTTLNDIANLDPTALGNTSMETISNGFKLLVSCARQKLRGFERQLAVASGFVQRNQVANRSMSESLDQLQNSVTNSRNRSSQLLQESRAMVNGAESQNFEAGIESSETSFEIDVEFQ